MTRAQLLELGYIVPIETVPSILKHGVLSHVRAQRIGHKDISLGDVEDLRSKVIVPAPGGGRRLHDYANLYICPRNPMLLKRSGMHQELCVLRVNPNVLDIAGTVVTDMNAGSKYAHFAAAPAGLSIVDRDRTFDDWWTHDDQRDQWRHSAQKCAEVLVPNVVPAVHIVGAYVSCEAGREALTAAAPGLGTSINAHLFFQ